jgi:hypothetical protein
MLFVAVLLIVKLQTKRDRREKVMSLIFKHEIRSRLREAFPQSFINMNFELIVYPKRNTYFLLEDVLSERVLKCKVLEWLSREAAKSIDKRSQKYHMEGINTFLGTSFTQDDMMEIYDRLGNSISRKRSLRFVDSGYDLAILREGTAHD